MGVKEVLVLDLRREADGRGVDSVGGGGAGPGVRSVFPARLVGAGVRDTIRAWICGIDEKDLEGASEFLLVD